jgi:hypothetical protein
MDNIWTSKPSNLWVKYGSKRMVFGVIYGVVCRIMYMFIFSCLLIHGSTFKNFKTTCFTSSLFL